ncbi:putative membrane protein [Campylobacter blaseri]|uniref:Integral membrane protein n=1 Tax=Campylobacter blaseri TaxID=2042961 RepID=A0A2P8R0Z8_9BACT|nr:hypothetical protein [Campylobacter blaseri]PSM52177.1 hypothetical protein CQ405_03750 [Campylobacter blaseri]PSM53943.1 hypothetical protein CRN67_03750 [Campylobacter blaseri]QKF85380.1 putative membrane protein [Campylobacter blaseri]
MMELYETSLSLHKFFALLVFLMSILHLILTQFGEGPKYAKRIRLFLPAYYSVMAMLFVTGANLLPILRFNFSYSVIVMIIVFIVMIGFGAIGFKALKRAYYTKNYSPFKKKMRNLIMINLIIILIASYI